ncbi:hypothetical protein Tco_1461134, partial [Tanacetum coccineum]
MILRVTTAQIYISVVKHNLVMPLQLLSDYYCWKDYADREGIKIDWRTRILMTITKQDLFKWDQHASNSANPDPMISPKFVEANYEVLESLLRERRRQICSKYIRTKLEYFSEEYDEEREMEQRHARVRESEGGRPSERRAENIRSRGENLPPLLVAHLGRSENDQPLQSTLTSVFGGHQPSTNLGGNLPPNDSNSCVTLFVHWIEDYPLLDGLKMPSHVGSYDGKGDPDNYLHLFEGAI